MVQRGWRSFLELAIKQKRQATWYNHFMKTLITRNSEILGGKPVIADTRMSVEVVLEFLAGGMEIKEILKEFPFLNKEQVQAAIGYAAKRIGEEGLYTATPHEIYHRR